MSIRESINRHPMAVLGIAGLLVVVFAIVVWRTVFVRPSATNPPTQAYYTVDEGQTWFADDLEKEPPFLKDGKEAVRAMVYSVDGGNPQVLYLMKATPALQAALATAKTPAERMNVRRGFDGGANAYLVKKPKVGEWVDAVDPAGIQIKSVPPGAKAQVPPSQRS